MWDLDTIIRINRERCEQWQRNQKSGFPAIDAVVGIRRAEGAVPAKKQAEKSK